MHPPELVLPIPTGVEAFIGSTDWGKVVASDVLKGGVISYTRRLTTQFGPRLILKQSRHAPADLYAREAVGLNTLGAAGLRTPDVYAVGTEFLLVEDLGAAPLASVDWEQFGRAIAHLHSHTHPVFGFEHDNYLGLLRQYNPWTDDGHVFFGQNRLLRYLSEPLCEQTLTADDRQAVERLVHRLPSLIPVQAASLVHGDLWRENMLNAGHGQPAIIDPAVYYGWPEAELSMMQQYEGVPNAFFDAYREVHPLEEGWPERLDLLRLRELLSVVAHFGDRNQVLNRLRAVLQRFA